MTDKLREALAEAVIQLEYLNEKEQRGTTNAAITRARAALAAAPQPAPVDAYSMFRRIYEESGGPSPELREAYAKYKAATAPQPEDDHPDIPDTPEDRAYRKGWNEGIAAGHKLVPIDDPAAPQPAPEEGLTRAQVGAMLDAKRHDREALVRLLQIITRNGSLDDSRTPHEVIADALLALGLRLPGADETMAWAVVGEDGKIDPRKLWINSRDAEEYCERGERAVRVAIRVVKGGDDAA